MWNWKYRSRSHRHLQLCCCFLSWVEKPAPQERAGVTNSLVTSCHGYGCESLRKGCHTFQSVLLEIVFPASLLKMLIWCEHFLRRRLIDIWQHRRTAAPHCRRRNNNQMLSFSRTFLPKKIKPLALCYLNYLQGILGRACLSLPERGLWLKTPPTQATRVWIFPNYSKDLRESVFAAPFQQGGRILALQGYCDGSVSWHI